MTLFNIGSEDPNLRLAAYNLLVSLSNVFNFDVGNQLLATKGMNFTLSLLFFRLNHFIYIMINLHTACIQHFRVVYSCKQYKFCGRDK